MFSWNVYEIEEGGVIDFEGGKKNENCIDLEVNCQTTDLQG